MDTINPIRGKFCDWPDCAEYNDNCRLGISAPCHSIQLTGERLQQERLAIEARRRSENVWIGAIACAVIFASGFIVCAVGFGGGWRPW